MTQKQAMNENSVQEATQNDNPTRNDNPLMQPLRTLLDAMDTIIETHRELDDTVVREYMSEAIHSSFVLAEPNYVLPKHWGMFRPRGNQKVHKALRLFLSDPAVKAARKEITSPSDRQAAFQDGSLVSGQGRNYDFYFGSREQL